MQQLAQRVACLCCSTGRVGAHCQVSVHHRQPLRAATGRVVHRSALTAAARAATSENILGCLPGTRSVCDWPGLLQDLWICLICGHIGCGRYHSKHAVAHWRETQHCYALDLETQRVRQLYGARLRGSCLGGPLTAACDVSGVLPWQSAAFSLFKRLHAASLQDCRLSAIRLRPVRAQAGTLAASVPAVCASAARLS